MPNFRGQRAEPLGFLLPLTAPSKTNGLFGSADDHIEPRIADMSALLRIVSLAMSFILAGCMAAPVAGLYAISAVSTGWVGYKLYKTSSGATIEFRFERSEPKSAALEKIRRANRLAIYPSRNAMDGDDIDIFRKETNMDIVSSSRTISWVEKNKLPSLNSLPTREKYDVAARLARNHQADVALVVSDAKTKVDVKPYLATTIVEVKFSTVLVDAKSGEALWVERQELLVDGIAGPGVDGREINRVIVEGIARRLMDLRLGRDPEQSKDQGIISVFECGGSLNFTCDKEKVQGDQSPQNTQTVKTKP